MAFTETVSAGMTVNDEVVNSGTQTVLDGGTTNNNTIQGVDAKTFGTLVVSGGTLNNLTVTGGTAKVYISGGVLNNVDIRNYGTDGWYTGDEYKAHMVMAGGTINGGSITAGMITTAGDNNQLMSGTYIGSISGTAGSDYRGLLYANIRWGAGTMSSCTIGSGGTVLFGYSNVDNQNFATKGYNLVIAGGSLDMRTNASLYNTTVNAGTLSLQGANCSGTIVNGGTLDIYNNGVSSNTVMTSGGKILVRAGGTIDNSDITHGTLWVLDGGKITNTKLGVDTVLLGANGGYINVSSFANFSNVTINGIDLSASSVYATKGSKIANVDATVTRAVVDGGTYTMYAAGSISNVTIKNSGWLQTSNGKVNNAIIEGVGARFEAMSATILNGATVDGKGEFSSAFGTGARLVIFNGAKASNITLQNGGSAHIYGSGTVVTGTTVKNGGILYMHDIYGTAANVGSATNVNVHDGGKLVLGNTLMTSSTATGSSYIKDLKLEEAAILELNGTDFIIINGSIKDNGTYQSFSADGKSITGVTLHRNSFFKGHGVDDASVLKNITAYEGSSITGVGLKSTINGTFKFADGTTQELKIADGKVESFVVGGNSVLFGANTADTEMNNVTIFNGGTMSEVGTNATVSGQYIQEDGTKISFSIANKVATNLFFNNGGAFLVTDGGSASAITLNNATMFIENGSAQNITMKSGASLMIGSGATLSGVNFDYTDDDYRRNFSVAGGIYDSLVIASGGFLSIGSGNTAKNVYLTGKRSIAAAGYTDEMLKKFGGASFLQAGNGSKIEGATFDEDSMLYIASTADAVTATDLIFESGSSLHVSLGKNVNISGTIYGFKSDVENKGLDFSVANGVVTNLRLVEKYSKLELASGMNVNNIEVINAMSGITADASNTFSNMYIEDNGTFGFHANVNGLELIKGVMQARASIENASVYNESTLSTSMSNAVFTNVTLYDKSTLTLGTAKNEFASAQSGSVIDGVTTAAGFTGNVKFTAGTLKNLVMNGGTFTYDAAGANGTFGRDGIVLNIAGKFIFKNTIINNGFTDAITLTSEVTRFELAGGNTVNSNIVFTVSAANSELYITGDANSIKTGTSIKVKKVIFDVTNLHRAGAGMVNNLNRVNAATSTGAGIYAINADLRQGYFVLGALKDGDTTFNRVFQLSLPGMSTTPLRIGRSVTVGGYTITLDDTLTPGYAILTIKADASTNTKFSWKSSTELAPTYCNDITATSGTLYLGNTLETTAGGHAFSDIGNTVSAAGIITDKQVGLTVYGGSDTTNRSASWIRVIGGEKNVVYGGGNGKNLTGGANIWVTGGVCDVYGGGTNSNIGAGKDGNAVNIAITGGSQRYVYGGGVGGTITGNVMISASNTSISKVVAGGGMSNVKGDISISLNLIGSSTGNMFGGTISANAKLSVEGDISMKLTGGEYQGLIIGGGRSFNGTNNVNGSINVSVSGITQIDNQKLLSVGNSAWIIGGGVAAENGDTSVNGDVTVNISGNANIVRIVGGIQATGAGSTSSITGDTIISVTNANVSGDIYAGGYAYDKGLSVVKGTGRIFINAGTSTTIDGNIYGGGANPNYNTGGSSLVMGGSLIVFSGNSDNLSFSGTVSGDGKVLGSVTGTKTLKFDDFSGEFGATAREFNVISFAGDTAMSSINSMSAGVISFDLSERSNSLSDNAFLDNADSFNFEEDSKKIELVLGKENLSGNFSFNLFDVSDENLEDVKLQLLDASGKQLGYADLSDVINMGMNLSGKGVISMEVDEFGYLNVSFKKGTLA